MSESPSWLEFIECLANDVYKIDLHKNNIPSRKGIALFVIYSIFVIRSMWLEVINFSQDSMPIRFRQLMSYFIASTPLKICYLSVGRVSQSKLSTSPSASASLDGTTTVVGGASTVDGSEFPESTGK